MSEHTTHHARNTSDRFKKDEPNQPFSLVHHIWLVRIVPIAGGQICAPSEDPDHVVGRPVGQGTWLSVSNFDALELILGRTRVRP